MIDPNPCHKCTERYTACHDHCDKHKKWKAQHQAQNKHLKDNAYRFSTLWSPSREKTRRKYCKYGVRDHNPSGRGGSQ